MERRDDGLHIVEESLLHEGASVPLYILDQPSRGRGTDCGVAYNNFAKGPNKPRVTCSDQQAIFTQLTSPATFDAAHMSSRDRIPRVVHALEQGLSAFLFLDPVPIRMREYAFPSDKVLQGDGRNLSAILYNIWGGDRDKDLEAKVIERPLSRAFSACPSRILCAYRS